MGRLLQITSFLGGAAVALALVAGWRIPAGDGRVGADVTFSATAARYLTLSPTGPFVTRSAFGAGPGRILEGRLRAYNASGRTLRVRARIRADSRDLDDVLYVELRSGRVMLFRGPLRELRRWTTRSFAVPPQRGTALTVRAALAAAEAADGRAVLATVELRETAR